MSDPFKPSVGLLAKLGSIAQHIDEVSGEDGHAFDWVAIRSLLADGEVMSWLDKMDKHGLLPVRRDPAQRFHKESAEPGASS
jgi:hypothetical protein